MRLKFILLLFLVFSMLLPTIYAQEKKEKDNSEKGFRKTFVDTTDNALDVSKWMTDLHGVLPLPTIITEPALGYGLNLALVFFHPTKQSLNKASDSEKRTTLPSMTVAGGLYTANGTWGVYGGHYGSYLDDKLRVAAFSGWLDINISFFLTGQLGNEHELKFNLKGLPIYLSAAYKLGKSPWYSGLDYFFYINETTLKTQLDIPDFDNLTMKTQLGGIGLNVYREDFDNSFTPNKGTKIKARFGHYNTWLGSDYQYNNFNVTFLGVIGWEDDIQSSLFCLGL